MSVRVRQRPDRPGWYLIIDHHQKRKKQHFPDKETALIVARKIRERLALGDFKIAPEDAVEGRVQLKRRALKALIDAGKVQRTGKGTKGDPFRYGCKIS